MLPPKLSASVALLLLALITSSRIVEGEDTHVWHQGAINCFECDNAENCAASAGTLRKCLNNDAQTCVTVFNAAGAVVQRGCSDAVQAQCDVAEQSCYECRSQGCNTIESNKEFVNCLSCDAQSDVNCIFNVEAITATRQCYQSCITAVYSRTSEKNAPGELVRSCLDDLDLDEREACAAGSDANCVACTTEKCNNVALGEHGSCYACSGDDCEDPVVSTCRAVVDQEQCFIEFDELDSVIKMGCASDYDNGEVEQLLRNKRLWLCEGDNCNTFSELPEVHTCSICSSRTDPYCATIPGLVDSVTICSDLPNTDCYERLLDSGHTERGCISSLEGDEFYNCLTGVNSTACATCTGDKCNTDLHPAERLSCHVCSSKDSASCEAAPEVAETCLLYTAGEQCVSAIDSNGFTVRGCSSEVTCASTDSQSCQTCRGANCNTANLKRKSDGKPGQWQELPLKCLSCSSTTECESSSIASEVCADTEYCMTVFADFGVIVARGCSDAIEKTFSTYCDASADSCFNCNSNDCNSAAQLTDYAECIYCNSLTNPDCASSPDTVAARRKCNGQCMTALQKRGDSAIYDLVRSCLDDKDEADRTTCSAGSDTECVACTGDACNTVQLPETRLTCYTCAGDDCEDPQVAECVNYSPNDKCYIQFDELADTTTMGCYSDLSDEFIEENIHLLYTCDTGNNCNSFEKVPQSNKCVVCNSRENVNCAVAPESIGTVADCTVLPNTGCMSRVLSDGSTTRGCLSSLATDDRKNCLMGKGNCAACNGLLCNQEIYPTDRRRCYRCNTETDPSCGSSPATSSACPRYVENDGCSVKVVDEHTYRGCESEFACDDTDKQFCRVCRNGDNCNVVDLVDSNIGYPGKWQTPPINCYTCLGDECEAGNLGALQKCVNNDKQNCATVFDSEGVVVQRGCSDLIYGGSYGQYCDDNSGSCKFCKSTGCNNAKELSVYVDCLLCDGTENDNCVLDADSITRKISCQNSCVTGLYPRNNSDATSALELTRGCLDDLEYDDRELCSAGNKAHCKSCTGASCNTDAVPETRLSCNYCADETCETLSPKTCISYRDNDQCYIHVGDLKIESMGCASDLESSFLTQNKRDLLLCTGDNCNVRESLNLNGILCYICSSNVFESCVTTQPPLGAQCQHYIYPQCFDYIKPDGNLRRGCLMDTDDELFEECTSEDNSKCTLCDTDMCNSEIYPSDRRSCLTCDSDKDANCEKNPSEYASYCRLYDADDVCVTKVERTRTLRGCGTALPCDPNSGNCRTCEENNCNSIDLVADYVGEPGKWQTLPLNCLVCDSEEECANGGSLHKCQDNNKQVCVTVFGENDKVQKRGCSDSIVQSHADYCDTNPAKCPKCKSSGCNDADSTADYIDCYFCDADEDPSCAFETPTRTRKCQKQCLSALYPRSSAADTALIATHSCLDDLEYDDREACAAGTKEHCKACATSLCNGEPIIEEPHECYTCATADCEDQVSTKCAAYRPNDQCYIAFDEYNIVAMGCVSEYETQVVLELVQQQKLYVCDGKNCNSAESIPDPNTCTVCDSEADPRCATNPNTIFETSSCSQVPYTQCVAYIDKDGFTQRGCLASLEGSDFYGCLTGTDNLCNACTGEKCNGLSVIPDNRLKCHQCDSATDPACLATPDSSSYCPVYVENDGCVTLQRGDVIVRGCNSTVHCDDETDTRTCRICKTGDDCNTIDLGKVNAEGSPGTWQDVPINCYVCTSEEDCADSLPLRSCLGNRYQNCMTVFNADGKVIQRGCTDSVLSDQEEYCDGNDGKCPRCNSNGCNEATSLDDYVECLVCDSQKDANCVLDVPAITSTRQCYKHCMSALLPLFKEENDAYSVVRSCYDDKDEEARLKCESGDDEQCAICSDAKCNTVDLIEQRLSCNVCTGDDCQAPATQKCPNYREGDQCYIEFDDQRTAVAFGCLSQYSHADEYNLLKSKRLWLCSGDNCNTYDAIPNAQTCTICSSRTEVACATNPTSIESQTTCATAGIPECYARVLDDGSTERGCLASLHEDEFLGCYNGTSKSCTACQEDKCNKDIYPTGRRSCHICDSASNGNCENSPSSLSICPLYAEDDMCVTNYRNGITYRGCGTAISCDESDPRSCVKCSEDGCNVVDLVSQNDDNYGKWQDLPLTCLTCVGDDCDATGKTTSETCQNNNEQDCLTVFDASGKVVRRGCADAVQQEHGSYCASNAGNCLNCKSNECNSATAKSDFVECVYCDSFKDINCLWNPTSSTHKRRQCQGGCMSALYPAYDSEDAALDIIRTCLNDKEEADQATCSAGSDANCVACTSANCNVENIPANRLTCYTCEGAECESPESRPCAQHKEDDQCFIWLDDSNSISQLGCLSTFRNQDLPSIIKTKRVAVCEGADCNLPVLPSPTQCVVCDSKEDPLCAVNVGAIGTIETCGELPYPHCVTKLEDDGSTIRGCLFELPQDDFAACVLGTNENCTICAEDGCNRELFPADRQQCYTCTSADDANCESLPDYALPCALVTDTESCITTLSANNVTTRGCSSDLTCDPSDYKNCRSCQGTECNSIELHNRYLNDDGLHGLWQDLPLRCHSCAGEHCEHSIGPAYECTRNNEQDCKTVFNADNSVLRRGCAEDVDDYEDRYCRENPSLCFTCKSNECNNAWSVDAFVDCAFCNSATDPLCVTNPTTTTFQKRPCQGRCSVSLKDSELIRSCLDDKEVYDRSACTEDETGKECAQCSGELCNTFVYPANRLRCHVCTGAACTSSVSEYCRLYDENDFCFAKYENGAVELMGCGSAQSSSDIEDWSASKKLHRCSGNDCNDLTKLPSSDVCVSCDSTNLLTCAQNPTAVSQTIVCSAPPLNECVTRLDSAGHTIRGCLNSLSEAEQNSCVTAGTCAACTGEKCNKEIFPANRRRCHICNSKDDTTCTLDPAALTVCPTYVSNESCVAKNTFGLIERGCHSDLDCDASEEHSCQICGSDGCNINRLPGGAAFLRSSLLLTLILAILTTFGLKA